MRTILCRWLTLFYCVIFWVLMALGIATLATMTGHCQTPPDKCSTSAMVRALWIASDLLQPEPTVAPLQFQIVPPPAWVPVATTPGPSWIPKARCRGPHRDGLTQADFTALASCNQWRVPSADYAECHAFPAGFSIAAQWWEYQKAEYCGEPDLDRTEGNTRRVCWGSALKLNAHLVIPGTPSAPTIATPARSQAPRTMPTRDGKRDALVAEFQMLSRLCGTAH